MDCSGSGKNDETLFQIELLEIDNTFVLPACVMVPSTFLNTSSLTLSSIGSTPVPEGFVTATKNTTDNQFTLKFKSMDPYIDG